jgi:hypothetical protein
MHRLIVATLVEKATRFQGLRLGKLQQNKQQIWRAHAGIPPTRVAHDISLYFNIL